MADDDKPKPDINTAPTSTSSPYPFGDNFKPPSVDDTTLYRTMRDIADDFERGNERARGTRIEVIATAKDGRRYAISFMVDDSILDTDSVAQLYLKECVRAVLEPIRRNAQTLAARELTPET